ncbi:MAG: TIGR00266 family protein, partial [Acidobacteria bacterium]|nr:TIGR00266 family protein [Acidobacteriota bacterium]
TGPGRVWLQTLPLPRLAHALQEYITVERARESGEAGAIGAIVGSVLRDRF